MSTRVTRFLSGLQSVAWFYRMQSWQNKVSGIRPLLYTVFGYAIASQGRFYLLAANLLAVLGLLMFFGAYGNYWDWRLLGEQNSTQVAMERHGVSAEAGLALSLIPWVGIIPLLLVVRSLGGSPQSACLFWLVAGLGVIYITPGLRLKVSRAGFCLPVLAWCLLFLQAYALHGKPLGHVPVLLLFGLLLLFQFQSEFLHLFDDSLHMSTEPMPIHPQRLLTWLKRFPKLSCVASLAVALVYPVFLNTAVWSLVRLRALRGLSAERVSRQRRQLWRPLWSLYEFAIYAVLAQWHRFA